MYTLVGGSSQSVDFQPNILAQHLIDKYNGHATILTAPFMCQSKELCSAIKEEPTIASILKASHNLDVTLVGIGEAPVRDADHLSDYPFDTTTINELVDAEAAGDICGNFFTITGELCDTTIKELESYPSISLGSAGNTSALSVSAAARKSTLYPGCTERTLSACTDHRCTDS